MSLDLRDELESLTASIPVPADLAGRAALSGQRRLTVRRRVTGLGSLAAVVLLAVSIVQWPRPAGTDPTPPAVSVVTDEQAVSGVSLPDPAPGFPVRLQPDPAPRQITVDGVRAWSRSFSVASTPEGTASDGTGIARGPEAAVEVGTFPLPVKNGAANGQAITDRVVLAGTVGYVTTFEETPGERVTALYFRVGSISVAVVGLYDATTEQLVTLGSALVGLPPTKATDLTEVKATNGRLGYVDRAVLDELTGANVANPEEALAWNREVEGYSTPTIDIPVYDADGTTQIGVFPVSRTGAAKPSPSS